jgi:hypothetical protein
VLSIIVDPNSNVAAATYRGRTQSLDGRGAAEFDFHSIENGRWPVSFETASGAPASAVAASVEIRSY